MPPELTPPRPALAAISSMATRDLLTELTQAYRQQSGEAVTLASVGGLDAEARVRAGEAFDVVFLACDAIDRLIDAGHLQADSRVDLVRSAVAVAVPAGSPHPSVDTLAALQAAVRTADRIGVSTGPSGQQLTRLFKAWGLDEVLRERLVVAPTGVPVGQLVASGEVSLGFQQRSELMFQDGIEVLGTLPDACAIVTTFSAGLCARSNQAERARDMLNFMASPQTDAAKRRHGMAPAVTRTPT